MRARATGLALATVLALATACGTTVTQSQLADGGSGGAGGLGTSTGVGGSAGSGTTTGSLPAGQTTTGVGSGTLPGTTGGTAGSGATTGSVGVPGSGTGATTGTVRSATGPVEIGIVYDTSQTATAAAVGAEGANPADAETLKRRYQVIVDDVNAHGGLLGRKMVTVYFGFDSTSPDGPGQDQSICSQFTQDHHVFATMLISSSTYSESLLACLNKAGVIPWSAPSALFDDQFIFDRYKLYTSAGSLNLTTAARVYVEGLWSQGYFTKGARIGLATYDSPSFTRAVNQGLKPALARHGLKLDDEVRTTPFTNLPATGNAQAQLQSGVLRFASEQITHVLFLGTSGFAFFWMTTAESQQYRPKYGVSTQDTPGPLAATAPAAQLKGSVGVGWNRVTDLTAPPPNAVGKRCEQILASRGEPGGTYTWANCDQVWTFARAVNNAGQLAAPAVVAALPRMRDLQVASALALSYAGGRRDGAAAAIAMAFDSACTCFKYRGSTYAIGP